MKFSFVIILLMGFYNVKGQDSLLGGIFPMENGEVTYSDEISMDSLNKDEIFLIVRDWARRVYPSRQVWDENEESQIFKGFVPFLDTSQGGVRSFRILYTIKFLIGNEFLRIVITDLQLEHSSFLYNARGKHKFEELLTPTRFVLPKKEKKQSINYSSKADPNFVNNFMSAMLKSIGHHITMVKTFWFPCLSCPNIRMEER